MSIFPAGQLIKASQGNGGLFSKALLCIRAAFKCVFVSGPICCCVRLCHCPLVNDHQTVVTQRMNRKHDWFQFGGYDFAKRLQLIPRPPFGEALLSRPDYLQALCGSPKLIALHVGTEGHLCCSCLPARHGEGTASAGRNPWRRRSSNLPS